MTDPLADSSSWVVLSSRFKDVFDMMDEAEWGDDPVYQMMKAARSESNPFVVAWANRLNETHRES